MIIRAVFSSHLFVALFLWLCAFAWGIFVGIALSHIHHPKEQT